MIRTMKRKKAEQRTTEERAKAYMELIRKRRTYYQKHAEERKAYQRERYRKMRDALKREEGRK